MSDLKFSRDGRHMLARDFMGLKLWDVRSESAPVETFPIHEHLKGKVGANLCGDRVRSASPGYAWCPSGV